MQFKDQIDFIRQHMKRNKLRVATTILAATMGCAFLIVLASVGFGLHQTITDDVLDNNMVTQIEVAGKSDGEAEIPPADIPDAELQQIKEMAHVIAVVERNKPEAETEIVIGNRSTYSQVVLSSMEEEQKAGFALSEGKMPTKAEEVVVGYHMAERLLTEAEMEKEANGEEVDGFAGSLIGQTVEVELTPFTAEGGEAVESSTWEFVVTGVAKEPAKDWMTDAGIYADSSWGPIFNEEMGLEKGYENILVYADELQNVGGITDALKEDEYYVYSVTEELGTMNVFFTALKAGLIFVGTIAVLIASIGIFNTMTMAVTERTREIGVMKAIGAQPKLIRKLFLMESAAIGLIGTALAVAISYGISILANWLVPIIILSSLGEEDAGGISIVISTIPWQLVVIASAISIGVAMVSGWRPARKATQIDIIQALRQEM
ncbi:FtsX-like permease family protein [Planomicrobium sp. Y74]|uniref:ABC transporter permease n=1 Tax=Planomicrobium sp. Y74 TaxID=2478977 RepID=UPI000EF4F28B|nr:FtsX-like permease family protein [Planomicrobium sp. Y74]RLQ90790.1 ABC transporter permease [Planomicrobium sp. Y74]